MSIATLKPVLQVGGTLTPGKHLYIVRPEDEELFDLLIAAEYTNVLAPRQMGKSSLVAQTRTRLATIGIHTAYVYCENLRGAAGLDDWYCGLLQKISEPLGIDLDVRAWWSASRESTANLRLNRFFLSEFLTRFDGPAIIFLDEIDSTLTLPYTDDFFVAIRAMYNQRSSEPLFERLTFCLVGVATPNELIKERSTTPYNIGKTIELRDFDIAREDLTPLFGAVADDPQTGKTIVRAVLEETGGHPYLTHWICEECLKHHCTSAPAVRKLIAEMFTGLEAVRSHVHFGTILRLLDHRMPDRLNALANYRSIWNGVQVKDEPTPAIIGLKLTGLVKPDKNGCLIVRNAIYRRLFSDSWVGGLLPRQMIRQEAGILTLIDIVDYTPQVERLGTEKAELLRQYVESELKQRAEPRGFQFVKTVGDITLLFGSSPEGLIELMLDLFSRNRIPPHNGFALRFRMVADSGYFHLVLDENDQRIDIKGADAVDAFGVEKRVETWRLLVTDSLFRGVQHLLERNRIEHRELRETEPLKGWEIFGRTMWHNLIPPQDARIDGHLLHEHYIRRREALREDVRVIPIFGNLYEPIPMADSFINLTLETDADWPEIPAINGDAKEKEQNVLFGTELKRFGRPSHDITAEQLFHTFNKGCIFGLPGAGKTTILNHFAWQLLEEDPNAVILFVKCRDLRPNNFIKPRERKKTKPVAEIDRILRALTLSFLNPGIEESQLDAKEVQAVEAVTEDIQAAWAHGRLTILIDALDEASTDELKAELIRQARGLFDAIKEKHRKMNPNSPPSNRFFLAARTVERQRLDPKGQPVFDVRQLTLDHMRRMAERFFSDDPELIKNFDDRIWREPVVQTMGGTPLTAQLLLFYYNIFRRFNVRYATYTLLLEFVLLELWEKIRDREFKRDHFRLNDFFEQVRQDDFLHKNPDIALQINALASLAFSCLYSSEEGMPLRDIPRHEILASITRFLESKAGGKHAKNNARNLARQWTVAFEREHLLVATGSDSLRFVHSTMMEYLAARYVLATRSNSKRFAKMVSSVANYANCAWLETLPIACGESLESGAAILKQLKRPFNSPNADLVLPFRCVAELETAERERMHGLVTRITKAAAKSDIDKLLPAKRWVYERLRDLVLGDEAGPIREAHKKFAGLIPLCQETFPSKFIKGWDNAGSDVVDARRELLKLILHKDINDKMPKVSLWKEPHKPAVKPDENLLTLDRPGEAEDKNFEYYRGELEKVHAGWGEALRGFLGSPNLRHSGGVWAVAVAPDGRTFVSASGDGTLKLWDVSSGRELRAFTGHERPVRACGFSPDGERIISGSDDFMLKLWDVASGRELRLFTGHQGAVTACGFSPDGERIISGSNDATLKLWDVASGRELRAFTGHKVWVLACSFSPDGERIISGSGDRTLKFWDVASSRELRTFTGHKDSVMACGFSRDGERIISGSEDATLKLWDVSSGRELRAFTGHKGAVRACVFSPDGEWIISGSDDYTLKLWDVSSGRELRAFTGHKGTVMACGFSRDGERIISGSSDDTLKLWDVPSGRELRAFTGHERPVRACGFSPDGERIISGSNDAMLKLWDVASGRELRAFTGHKGAVLACGFSPDGERIISGSYDAMLKLWDVASGRELRAFTGHKEQVVACGFSPDGERIISGSYDQTLKLWDVASGRELRAFTRHKGAVLACGFSPDGERIISGSHDKTLRLWDVASGRELRAFTGHEGLVRTCGFSPDGEWIISGSDDDALKLWDVASGRELRAFTGHGGNVTACAFSADGLRLISTSSDKAIRVWDVMTGRELAKMPLTWISSSLSLSRLNPNLICTGNLTGTLTLFDLSVLLK